MTSSLEALEADVVPVFEEFERRMTLRGIRFKRGSTGRTLDEQIALFAQHRGILALVNCLRKKARMYLIGNRQNGYTVTDCDGIDNVSRHQLGIAADYTPVGANGEAVWPPKEDPRWLEMGEIGESVGLTWGGRWSSPDLPHYEYRRTL